MDRTRYAVIIGSGSYIPARRIPNDYFINHTFYGTDGTKIEKSNEEIIRKFREITGIDERRYVTNDQVASDIAFYAGEKALLSAGIDKETLDYIIVAHNFGDIKEGNRRSDCVPSLGSRVKQLLHINNSRTVAYDIPFGCAGWLQGLIQANYFIRSGDARRILVIGTDTLSRIADPHDRDSMIYADGSGAVVLEAKESVTPVGILSHDTQTLANGHAFILHLGPSSNPHYPENNLFLKMNGRKLYEQVLKHVPQVIKNSIDKVGISFTAIDKLLIHQANNKMDEAILKELSELCGTNRLPRDVMPMSISWLGNSSVATLPTLYDLMSNGQLTGHTLKPNALLAFAAVGAGININSMIYKVPAEV
jgi:3-oxoacyl-[acyl-carrier-protein] synthase-3